MQKIVEDKEEKSRMAKVKKKEIERKNKRVQKIKGRRRDRNSKDGGREKRIRERFNRDYDSRGNIF